MNHQYRVLTHCLKLLQESRVSELKKLRVAFQMVQLKRLLLKDDLPNEVTCGPCSEEVFNGLLAEMSSISRGAGREDAVDVLLVRLNEVLVSAVRTVKEHSAPPQFD